MNNQVLSSQSTWALLISCEILCVSSRPYGGASRLHLIRLVSPGLCFTHSFQDNEKSDITVEACFSCGTASVRTLSQSPYLFEMFLSNVWSDTKTENILWPPSQWWHSVVIWWYSVISLALTQPDDDCPSGATFNPKHSSFSTAAEKEELPL